MLCPEIIYKLRVHCSSSEYGASLSYDANGN